MKTFLLTIFILFPFLAQAHTTPCPPPVVCPDCSSYEIGSPFTPISSFDFFSSSFQSESMGFFDSDYSFDKRLSDGFKPWTNAATADLYVLHFPWRQYQVGDYIAVKQRAQNLDYTTTRILQITGLGVVSLSSCTAPSLLPLTVASPYLNNNGTTINFYRGIGDSSACTGGYLRWEQQQATVSLINFTPSCSDGVWNGDETGIDCGGSCGECETPSTGMTYDEKMKVLSGFIGFIVGAAILWTTLDW